MERRRDRSTLLVTARHTGLKVPASRSRTSVRPCSNALCAHALCAHAAPMHCAHMRCANALCVLAIREERARRTLAGCAGSPPGRRTVSCAARHSRHIRSACGCQSHWRPTSPARMLATSWPTWPAPCSSASLTDIVFGKPSVRHGSTSTTPVQPRARGRMSACSIAQSCPRARTHVEGEPLPQRTQSMCQNESRHTVRRVSNGVGNRPSFAISEIKPRPRPLRLVQSH